MLSEQRRISTVLAARISGYSHLVSSADENVQILLDELRENFAAVVVEFDGNLINNVGHDLSADFTSAVRAFRAAVKIRSMLSTQNSSTSTNRALQLCTGIHLGEIFVDAGTIVGDGVDVATKLGKIAHPGEVIISSAVHEQLEGKVDSGFVYSGKHEIENIPHPIRVFRAVDSAEKRPIRDVLSELFRRRIFRSAGAYFVAAWLLVQASDTVLPVFNTPSWVLRSIIILLIVGFPLAMLLTWSVNLSTDGLVKTTDTGYSRKTGRWLKFAVVSIATIISATVLWNIRATILEPPEEMRVVSRSPIRSQPVIAVAELTKRVGDASLDWLGQGIANLLRDSMADSPLTVVYSLAALQSLNSETGSSQKLVQAAKEAGVDYLIVGDYMSTTSGIVISVHIEDLGNGTIIPGDRIEASSVEEAIAGTTQLVRRLKQSLNLPYVSQVGHLAADFAADNLQAYELYVSGLAYLSTYDYENATNLLQAAVEEAPNFGIARYRLAQILEATGHNREAYQMLDGIDSSTLSERESQYVLGAKHKFTENQDTDSAIEVFLDTVSRFPFDSEAHQNLAEAYWLGYQNEASVKQLELLVELHPQEATSWMALGERQVDVGDIDGARVSLAKYLSMQPEDAYPHALLGELASHERRFSEAQTHYERALAIRPNMGIPELGSARLAYFRGNTDNAMSLWRSMIVNQDIPADFKIHAAFDYAYSLRALGRPKDAVDALSLAESEIQSEGFREALALTLKAEALVDLSQLHQARELLRDAVDKTPATGQPTRPFFHLAQIALQEKDLGGFRKIVEMMEALPIEPDSVSNNDRTAAVHYLTGISLIPEDPLLAASTIELALSTPDHFAYRLYELGLAEAQAAAGEHTAALTVLDRIDDLDTGHPRFDLEYDRNLKQVIRAEILAANGRRDEARDLANRTAVAWPDASPQHPVMQRLQNMLQPN